MQGKGLAAPDPKPSPSVNMANLTRLSVLIGEADPARSSETAELTREFGVRHVMQVHALDPLLDALKKQAFDVVICSEQLGAAEGIAVLRAVRNMAPATRTVLMRTNDRAGAFVPDDIEAIELPFSRLELQGLLHRTAAAHGGLWCEVPELSLSDILQMYHQARRSITVLLSGPIAGRVWLDVGDIVDAEGNGERGVAALSYLLGAESGLVRTEPPKGDVARTISAPFQSVILEAAHKLDERRRDTASSRHPTGGSAGSVPNRPVPSADAEHRISERSSVSSALMRPAMTPPVQAPSTGPEFYPERSEQRRQAYLATLGVLLGLAVVGAAASYLGNRVAVSQNRSASGIDERASARSATTTNPSGVASATPPASPAPVEPRAVAPKEVPPPAPRASPAATPASATTPSPRAAAPAPAAPASFELFITSKPPRATVNEGGRVLGRTPLRLAISKRSVTGGPREFIVHLAGYLPVKISQGASDSNVDAAVVLSPRPVVEEAPDGGLYEPDFDPAGARSGNAGARRRDLGIRLRR